MIRKDQTLTFTDVIKIREALREIRLPGRPSFCALRCNVAALLAAASVPSQKEKKVTSSRRPKGGADEMANMAFRFVGYPDEGQQHAMLQNIGGCRWMWNRMKADRDLLYKEMGIYFPITPADYKDLDECSWLKGLDSLALANVQLRHERAYNDFFSGDKGYPRFKKKGLCRDSYTTNNVNGNLRLEGNLLTLPKVPGTVRLRCHRKIPAGYTLKSCTVSHEPDGKWMFSLLFEYKKTEWAPAERLSRFFETGDTSVLRHIGLDMSLPDLYVDSDGCLPSYENAGSLIAFRKAYRGLEKKIAREQRKLSRMVRHSSNYEKQCVRIASLHARAKQQRSDFLHQMAVRLARSYDVISIEDLDMSAMKRALRFGKSVSDNGWGTFIRILEEKCLQYGTLLIKVDKWFPSSKTCMHCGHIHKELKLSDRTYICPKCGHVMDRDHQAAVNIDEEGLRMLRDSWKKARASGKEKFSLSSPYRYTAGKAA